ncbi:MAG: cell envelope integrity protein CreD [Gammaproteobacteria bacterium]
MKHFLLKKFAALLGLMIVLLIALEMISGVIGERSRYRNDAKHGIAASWTGSQNVIGPVLVVPYEEKVTKTLWDKKLKREVVKVEQVCRELYLMPDDLKIDGRVGTEMRYRGLYAVPVYSAKLAFSGKFAGEKVFDRIGRNANIVKWGEPYLAVPIGDTRGIPSRPALTWEARRIEFRAGSRIRGVPQGMHAALPAVPFEAGHDYSFSFELSLRGMEELSFAPAGENTEVALNSDWPHPGFSGRYLPERRSVSDTGFEAVWRASSFSSNIGQALDQCRNGNCNALLNNRFGVTLVQPVDVYRQSERSIKYAALFISLTFVAFLVLEIVKRLRIHPVQYLLVGLALAIFYLLLVSLSEHIAFSLAYLTAAAACSGLLGYYLTAVLGSPRQGVLFAGLIALLYGALYVILRSEDAALLMGSLLLFAALATLMAATRRVDWYGLGSETAPKDKPASL